MNKQLGENSIMDFNEQIKQLSKRISTLKNSVVTEEATKTSFIMPFFQILGYDVFNPTEFFPEYVADVGIKKGEKVDYAIIIDGKPCIFVECKSCNEDLDKHTSQLFRYFAAAPVKFGILTNGIVYRFYTDLEKDNIMDLEKQKYGWEIQTYGWESIFSFYKWYRKSKIKWGFWYHVRWNRKYGRTGEWRASI